MRPYGIRSSRYALMPSGDRESRSTRDARRRAISRREAMTLATTTTMPRARAIAPRRAPKTTRKRATTTRSTAIDAGDRFATATRTLAAVTLAATLALQQPADIAHAKSGADANVIERSSGLSPISDKAKSYGEEIDAREAGDYESSKRGSYNVREKYAKKAPKATKKFERPVREEAAPRAKKESSGGGFALPSFSLPSVSLPSLPSLPSFGGDAATEDAAPAEAEAS